MNDFQELYSVLTCWTLEHSFPANWQQAFLFLLLCQNGYGPFDACVMWCDTCLVVHLQAAMASSISLLKAEEVDEVILGCDDKYKAIALSSESYPPKY